jgi:hypothetical protein
LHRCIISPTQNCLHCTALHCIARIALHCTHCTHCTHCSATMHDARREVARLTRWHGLVYIAPPDTYRCAEHNPHEDTPCRPSPLLPIIGLPALLTLADWCRKRQEMVQGGDPCTVPRMPLSPPAPESDNLSNQRCPEPFMVGPPGAEAGASAARPASCAGSAAPLASDRQGGAA